MSGGFKRSSRFGILGLVVVAGICAAIGLTLGSGEANPKLELGLNFAVLAIFFVVLFALRRADLDRVSGADTRGNSRAAAEGGCAIDNPMTMTEPDLRAALKNALNSTRWKKVPIERGPEGIVVARKGGGQSDWLRDLWLAERLASC